MNHLSAIYSLFVDLKVHGRLYLVCLTLYVLRMGLHVREGVKRHDIHIKLKF